MLFLGAYTPLTMEGNIIVEEVLASCYAFGNHDFAHVGVTPIRWFKRIMMKLIFGQNNGFSVYAITAEAMAQCMLWLALVTPKRKQ